MQPSPHTSCADCSEGGDSLLRGLFPACFGPSSLSGLQPVLAEVSRARTEVSITSDNRWLPSLSAAEAAHQLAAAPERPVQFLLLLWRRGQFVLVGFAAEVSHVSGVLPVSDRFQSPPGVLRSTSGDAPGQASVAAPSGGVARQRSSFVAGVLLYSCQYDTIPTRQRQACLRQHALDPMSKARGLRACSAHFRRLPIGDDR